MRPNLFLVSHATLNFKRKFDAELLEIQATRIQELLMSLAEEFPDTIGQEIGPDLEKEGLLNVPV